MDVVYYDIRSPGSFGGIDRLRRHSNKRRKDVVNYLKSQDAYMLHKPIRKRFIRRRTYSQGIGDLYQIDLADLSNLSSYNDSYRYLSNCIDVFSKRAWSSQLKSKSVREVTEAFELILDDWPCNMVQSDKGTEFVNSTFQSMLCRRGIKFYTSENEDIKAALVERFNRTLKEKMYCYFTAKNTRRYVDVLPNFIYTYNRSRHRSIGMAPANVSPDNEDAVRARLYPTQKKSSTWNFKIGDSVRMTMQRHPFHKGYIGNWSEEIFKVADRMLTIPVTYKLKDLASKDIKGAFYEDELQSVTKAEDELFDIERILKTRKTAGKVEYFVKWRGYLAKFNSWVIALTKR